MRGLELLVAGTKGQSGPNPPVIGRAGSKSDAWIVKPQDLSRSLSDASGTAVLVEVLSPLARSLRSNGGLVELLQDNPEAGQAMLDDLAADAQQEINLAIAGGAHGIAYRLEGADPSATSPMQYGGFFLERDRELLASASQAAFNLVLLIGGSGVYLDFVSDLPAHGFAWDAEASGFTLDQVRAMRAGVLIPLSGEGDTEWEVNSVGSDWGVRQASYV